MHAGEDRRHPGGFLDFGHPAMVRMCGREPVEVVLTEDPDGGYYGWLQLAHLHYPAYDEPHMVQPHAGLFEMQFPYGSAAEVERGHGEVVRMRVERA